MSRKTKMGRPPVMREPRNVVLRLERAARDQAMAVARVKGMSLAEVMRRALAEWVQREGTAPMATPQRSKAAKTRGGKSNAA
jgi:hypothetical protein